MIKKLVFTAIIATSLVACANRDTDTIQEGKRTDKQAPNPVNSTDGIPKTTVQIIDSVYDFGKVEDGALVNFSYRFKNTGDKPLVIGNATASCGCTVPEKPEQPILPGEIGYIKVKFDSKGRKGEAHKTVTVESNASPAFPQLLLKGTVI